MKGQTFASFSTSNRLNEIKLNRHHRQPEKKHTVMPSKFKLLLDADHQVKDILSDIFSQVSPEDIGDIEDSFIFQLRQNETDIIKNQINSRLTDLQSEHSDIIPKSNLPKQKFFRKSFVHKSFKLTHATDPNFTLINEPDNQKIKQTASTIL